MSKNFDLAIEAIKRGDEKELETLINADMALLTEQTEGSEHDLRTLI